MTQPKDLPLAPRFGDDAGKRNVRCQCHRLVMIISGTTIEIKCARCRQLILVETAGIRHVSSRDLAEPVWEPQVPWRN